MELLDRKISESINIHFKNIDCCANRREISQLWKLEKKHILKDVNGDFVSGKLTAVIGPSGCGKSTLLDIISGYRIKGVTGNVYVNGHEGDVKRLIQSSCYIMQDDLLEPFLTVHESMNFVANLKLPSKMYRHEKNAIIMRILTDFDLDGHLNTLTKNLSGGQRKKLAISLELISNPPVLFLDEPTSGLDSKSAIQCVDLLKKLSSEGRTVVCSIHQPSVTILNKFDHMYMLAEGKCIYQGAVSNLIPYLKANDLEIPLYHNPVEYVMELCVLDSDSEVNITSLVNNIKNGTSQEWFDNPTCWSVIPLEPIDANCSTQYVNVENNRNYVNSFTHQFVQLLHRKILVETRDPFLVHIRLLSHLFMGLLFGFVFFDVGNDGSKIMVNMNLMFLMALFPMFQALASRILSYPLYLPIIRREYFNRWYSTKAYYLSSLLADMPVQILSVVLFVVPTYYLTGQPNEWHRFAKVLTIVNLLSLVFQDYGILVGTLLDVQTGLIFGTFTTSPYVLFSGFFLYYRDTPNWFQFMYEISVLRHAVEGLATSVFGYGREALNCDETHIICPYRYPQDLLKFVDMTNDRLPTNIIFIVTFGFLIKIFCFFALKYRLSRGMWPGVLFKPVSSMLSNICSRADKNSENIIREFSSL